MIKNILITGIPGCGKSTLLREIVSGIEMKKGFVTNEILANGERVGFNVETSGGVTGILAGVSIKSEKKVSKYFVDVPGFEKVIEELFDFKENDFLYIDEIGKMELFSVEFKRLVEKYFNSGNICVATITKVYDDAFTRKIKKRDDVYLVEINAENRGVKREFVRKLIGKIERARKYAVERERFKIDGAKAELRSEHGTRKMILKRRKWECDCDFFGENGICSHVIAVEEVASQSFSATL